MPHVRPAALVACRYRIDGNRENYFHHKYQDNKTDEIKSPKGDSERVLAAPKPLDDTHDPVLASATIAAGNERLQQAALRLESSCKRSRGYVTR